MPSQVFMMDLRASAKETNFKKFQRLLDALDVKSIIHRRKKRPLVAVKLHFGEKGNAAFIRPLYVRQVVDKIWDLGGRPFLTDANTVYVGTRSESVSHLTTAIENGFAYAVVRAPLVIADGLTGKAEVEVKIKGEQFKSVFLAEAIVEAEALVTLTHFKLHELSGFGGALKNLGMGCASRKGKLSQHSNIAPKVTDKEVHRLRRLHRPLRPGGHQHQPGDGKGGHRPQKVRRLRRVHPGVPLRQHPDPVERIHPGVFEEDDGIRLWRHDHQARPGRVHQLHHPGVPGLRLLRPQRPAHRGGHRHRGLPGPGGHRPGLRRSGQPGPGPAGSALKNKSAGVDKFKDIYPQVDWPIQLEYAEKLGLGTREYELIKV